MSQTGSATGDRAQMTWPANSADDDEARDLARRIESEHPRWIVVFGAFTKQFICFPRFPAAPGTVLVASYPGALPARMKYADRGVPSPETGDVSYAECAKDPGPRRSGFGAGWAEVGKPCGRQSDDDNVALAGKTRKTR
jgi:hypothetical protein